MQTAATLKSRRSAVMAESGWDNVINHLPNITISVGGMITILSQWWFMLVLCSHNWGEVNEGKKWCPIFQQKYVYLDGMKSVILLK